MLEMLRRTRSTFRLDEEACEDEYYHGSCYTTYMEDPKPRCTAAEQRRKESKPKNIVPAAGPESTAPESNPKPNSSTTTAAVVPADPKSRTFKAFEVIIPVGLGILIDDSACGSRASKVMYCNKPMSIQTFPKNLINVMISTCSSSSSSSSSSSNNLTSSFLKICHLCKKNLRQDKDIFMYRGDLGFCSIECRSRQIFLDEREEEEMFLKAKAAPSPRCRGRSVQIPQADGRRRVLVMA